MAWHTPWRGVAWRGVAWHGLPCHDHNPRFEIAQNKHHINGRVPHLASPRPITTSHWGFPKGFPIASPPLPPYPVNHISILPFPRSSPSTSSSTTFCLLPQQIPHGAILPALAKLQVTSLPHFPSPRSPSFSSLVSLC
ncbi:hypothetical protein BC827DRAFT_1188072, partial [Russula dissimulans]